MGIKRLDLQSFKWGSKRNKRNSDNTQVGARPAHVLLSFLAPLLVLGAALYPAKVCAQSISVIQRATLNQQPSSSGTVTLALPKTTGAGHALIVGVSFWPLDLASVTDNSGDAFTRGLATSIYHNVSQGVLYTNFYYARNTAGGATTVTLNFSGGSTYVVAAVSEVAGLDPSAPLDSSAYHESLSSTTPWSSAALTVSTANEYLFAWAADEWNGLACSNPTAGWTENQTTAGATLCLMDRIVSASGSYQVSVTPAAAFNYAIEILAFKGASGAAPPPTPPPALLISTTTLPSGTVGSTYSVTLAAAGGVPPYTWSASALPAGLSISSNGTISGTPTTAGSFSASITVLDSTNARTSQSYSMSIAAAPPVITSSITVIQRATLNQQPSSSGTVTLALPKTTGAGHALIVGISFWPLDLASVTDNSGDAFTRGLATSIYHNVSQGVLYTNFYYARNTAGGATTITLNFSGGSTYVVAAVSEVAGLDPSAPLDGSAYHESLSSTTPWSSAALTTSTANEYLFAWAADEWTNPSCSNPTAGWTNTQTTAGATLCLVDRIVSASGSYQASVTPAAAFNYAMEILAFKGASGAAPPPTPPPALLISTTTLPSGTVGSIYSATLAATGGVPPYTWSASALPAGLSISSSGTISGTPTTAGSFSASITVLDSTNARTSQSYGMSIAAAPAPPPTITSSITVIQRATLNHQPSSSGTVTLALPKTTGAGHALIVGVSFWPLDLASVTDNSGDAFTRGLATSIYHNVSQGVLYTNFYYVRNTAGGATTITLNFSGGSTYVVAAVSEVAGLDPSAPLDSSAYHESLSSATPWSSAALTVSTANEYLFAWAADEWTNPSCSNPTAGWTNTQTTAGATLCLMDRIVSVSGSYQASVTPAAAFNYAMEILAFKGASGAAPPPTPPPALLISTTTLPSGTAGSTYSATLAAAGGVPPYTWSASALPAGLSISSSGTISGTPLTAGTQMASLMVKDASSTTASTSLSVNIGSAPSNSGLPPRPATTLSLLHFGNAGFGGDDTSVFQTAINYTASNSAALEIPAGSYNVSPLFLPANTYLLVDAGVTVTANSGFGSGDHLLNADAQNITIAGAGAATSVFHMRKAEYTSGEWRHCLDIENAANVTVSGISCNDSGGDGAYVRASTNVTIEDSIFNNNRRQGSSITGQVNHIYYLRDQFTNTNGTAPQSGIDIEPNAPGDFLLDINIDDCSTNSNAGDGLMFSTWLMDSTSQPIGITVLRHHSTGNQRYGYFANNNDPSNAPGTILIQDSFSDQSGSAGAAGRFYAANGASLTFQNLTVTNPHVNGPDPSYGDSAAVDVIRGGGGTVPIGNVHYLNINIAVTNGKVDHYFNFQDGSGVGVSNVQFVPGTLSGATQVPPNGLMQGAGYNSIP